MLGWLVAFASLGGMPYRPLKAGNYPKPFNLSERWPVMSLDFSSLASVVQRLEEGLVRFGLDTSDVMILDGLVQRFEFTCTGTL